MAKILIFPPSSANTQTISVREEHSTRCCFIDDHGQPCEKIIYENHRCWTHQEYQPESVKYIHLVSDEYK